MTVYICLLIANAIALLISDFSHNGEKKQGKLLFILFVMIFLLYSLRNSSVGRDIAGYMETYIEAGKHDIFSLDYVYFENGYTLFINICSNMGISFQWFLVITSIITLLPIYYFIKFYSDDKVLSCLIYICYIFFEFNLTGLRQAMATSIVLLGFILLFNNKKLRLIKYILCVVLASTFHQSALLALIFIPFFYARNYKISIVFLVLIGLILLLFRDNIIKIIGSVADRDLDSDTGIYLGWNIIFLILSGVFFLYAASLHKSNYGLENASYMSLIKFGGDVKKFSINIILIEVFFVGLVVYFIFGFTTLLRATQYASISIIVLFPNALKALNYKDGMILKVLFVIYLLFFFVYNTLYGNNLDIVPYSFFWSN